ncbi:MAG: ribonuclease HI [Deltaproteobacteria bacterium]|nr:ribonuclease HI [Deltaproteobacteria bacterium]
MARYTAGPRTGIFTDGSCEPNPGPGGWGFVWVQDDEIVQQKCGHEPDTTNNRMELTALIQAYESLPAEGVFSLYSDSQLCVKTVNEWAAGWQRRGWKRKTGPIKNLDLVKRLWTLAQAKPDIELKWIKAHDGSRWNEYADALASSWAR